MVNLKTLPDEELAAMIHATEDYLRKLENEQTRRTTIASVQERMNDLNLRYFQALGIVDGAPWEGPSSATEAYPADWTATHEGGLWKSTVPGNLEEPGEGEAWERVGDDPRFVRVPSESVLLGDDVLIFSPNESGEDDEEGEDLHDIDDVSDEGDVLERGDS